MIKLNTFSDNRGSLTVVETSKELPFTVKRAYWIYNVPQMMQRGKHANRITYQFLVAIKGSVKISLENKDGKTNVLLNSPDKGLLIPPLTWNELLYLSSDAVLLVLSSEHYQPENYINSHEEFIKILKEETCCK